jgi:YVTN family beta-propeller protein
LAVTPDGAHVYVTNSGGSTVSVIATASNTITSTISSITAPVRVAVTPDGTRAYVTNGSGSIWLINTTTNAIIESLSGGASMVGVAVTPSSTQIYAANQSGSTVTVFSTAITGCTSLSLSGTPPAMTSSCTPTLPYATQPITAIYTGDTNYTTATSSIFNQLNKAATTTSLAASPNPSTLGNSTTLTATIASSPGTPASGTYNFTSDGTTISGCGSVALSGTTATCSTAALTLGSHSEVATFTSGDTNYAGSNNSAYTQVVNQNAPALVVTSSQQQIGTGEPVVPPTYTAVLSITGTPGYTPSNGVTFYDNGATITGCTAVALTGSVPLMSATCTPASLSTGSHPITATYAGDTY